MTEISLYLDGILDSQIGIPIQNYRNCFLGKYDTSVHGFYGTISEVIFMPSVLDEVEIEEINNKCLDEFINGFYFNTANINGKIFKT